MSCNIIQSTGGKRGPVMVLVAGVAHGIVSSAAAIVMMSVMPIGVTGIAIGDDDKVFVFDFFDWLFLDFSVLFFFHLIFLWVIRWRDLNDGVYNHVKVWFFQSCGLEKFLVDAIEGFGVDAFGEVGVFLGPVLENCFKVGADFVGLFEHFFGLVVQIKLDAVADDH
jgi:hypothetical protein